MINPLRSEEDAFRFTLIVAALLAPVALVAIVVQHGRRARGRRRAGARARGRPVRAEARRAAARRLLLRPRPTARRHAPHPRGRERDAVGARAARARSRSRVARRAARAAGRLPGAEQQDQALDQRGGRGARRRLSSASSGCWPSFAREGFEADGDIGDDDPVQAMEDALRLFPADEVIISTHPPGRSNWLERDVVNARRERFDDPGHPRGRRPRPRAA